MIAKKISKGYDSFWLNTERVVLWQRSLMTNPENPNTGHNQFFQEKGVLFLLLLILEMEYIQDISFTKVNRSLSRSICFYINVNYI